MTNTITTKIFPLWDSAVYQQTLFIVLAFLFSSSLLIFFQRKKNYFFIYSWASLKSWLIVAPIFFILFGLPEPWPLVTLTSLAILGAKIFFQIMGMFHRTWFVWICYLGILGLAFCLHYEKTFLYNMLPMMVWGLTLLVPLIRNNFKKMIQYISLTNMAFILLGWSFLHLGWIFKTPSGLYQLMYLIILTEFCDNTNLALSYSFGRLRLFNRIDKRRSFEGSLVSILLTLFLAFIMRHLLPDKSDLYWLTAGLVASVGGVFGDLVMTVIRKDAGIHKMGQFILGRGDFLHRMDRLIFVAPIYYYVMKFIADSSWFHL
jgi:phosphatidate cytidylyltransferase